MGELKAIVADDEENVRYLLIDLIKSFHLGIQVVAQAGGGEEAMAELEYRDIVELVRITALFSDSMKKKFEEIKDDK